MVIPLREAGSMLMVVLSASRSVQETQMIQIVGVHLEGGNHYHHITSVRWRAVTSTKPYDGVATVQEVIDWLTKGIPVYSNGTAPGVPVATVYINRTAGRVFIESRADSTPLNNLLAQPKF